MLKCQKLLVDSIKVRTFAPQKQTKPNYKQLKQTKTMGRFEKKISESGKRVITVGHVTYPNGKMAHNGAKNPDERKPLLRTIIPVTEQTADGTFRTTKRYKDVVDATSTAPKVE